MKGRQGPTPRPVQTSETSGQAGQRERERLKKRERSKHGNTRSMETICKLVFLYLLR
jgi:hypothetical protein